MIKITLQRNDSKTISDKVSYTQDTITINEQEFEFPKGNNITFESPHEQIIDPKRDVEGVLHATIIKQYTGKEKTIFETCDEHGDYCECQVQDVHRAEFTTDGKNSANLNSPLLKSTRQKTTPIVAEIKIEEIKATTVADLIRNKETEVKDLKEQYLDADLDDNEELKISLKKEIQGLKSEIFLLNENVDKE